MLKRQYIKRLPFLKLNKHRTAVFFKKNSSFFKENHIFSTDQQNIQQIKGIMSGNKMFNICFVKKMRFCTNLKGSCLHVLVFLKFTY